MVDGDERDFGYAGAVLLILAGGNDDDPREILAVARLEALRRDKGAQRRALVAYDWASPSPAIPLTSVLSRLEPGVAQYIDDRLHRDWPTRLPVAIAAHLQRALDQIASSWNPAIRQRYVPRTRDFEPHELLAAERLDRNLTALRMSGVGMDADPLMEQVQLPTAALRLEKKMTERDMLAQDSVIVPEWSHATPSFGWYCFEKNRRRLYIKNIDFSPTETRTGGDLLYIRRQPDAIVAVQYKRLLEIRGGWQFRDDGRLSGQLDRLVALDAEGASSEASEASDDIRLSNTVGFVKFVDARPVIDRETSGLLEGCYLPAAYARTRREWRSGKGGPRELYNPREDRYLDSQTFVRLVAGGWLGGSATLTSKFIDEHLPRLVSEATGETTLAFDEPIPDQTTRRDTGRQPEETGTLPFEMPG
jgi:hypothetical protein